MEVVWGDNGGVCVKIVTNKKGTVIRSTRNLDGFLTSHYTGIYAKKTEQGFETNLVCRETLMRLTMNYLRVSSHEYRDNLIQYLCDLAKKLSSISI